MNSHVTAFSSIGGGKFCCARLPTLVRFSDRTLSGTEYSARLTDIPWRSMAAGRTLSPSTQVGRRPLNNCSALGMDESAARAKCSTSR